MCDETDVELRPESRLRLAPYWTMRNQLLDDRPSGCPLSGLIFSPTMRNQLLDDRPSGCPLSGLTFAPSYVPSLILVTPHRWPAKPTFALRHVPSCDTSDIRLASPVVPVHDLRHTGDRLGSRPALNHLLDVLGELVYDRLEPLLVVGDVDARKGSDQHSKRERSNRTRASVRDLVRNEALNVKQPANKPHEVDGTRQVRHPNYAPHVRRRVEQPTVRRGQSRRAPSRASSRMRMAVTSHRSLRFDLRGSQGGSRRRLLTRTPPDGPSEEEGT